MPLKHINDIDLQNIASGADPYVHETEHLENCDLCKRNLEFYREMFGKLNERPQVGFSSDFAYNVIQQVSIESSRQQKIKGIVSIFFIAVLFLLPIFVIPGLLDSFLSLGSGMQKFTKEIKSIFGSFDFNMGSILAAISLIAVIQIFEFVSKKMAGKR